MERGSGDAGGTRAGAEETRAGSPGAQVTQGKLVTGRGTPEVCRRAVCRTIPQTPARAPMGQVH